MATFRTPRTAGAKAKAFRRLYDQEQATTWKAAERVLRSLGGMLPAGELVETLKQINSAQQVAFIPKEKFQAAWAEISIARYRTVFERGAEIGLTHIPARRRGDMIFNPVASRVARFINERARTSFDNIYAESGKAFRTALNDMILRQVPPRQMAKRIRPMIGMNNVQAAAAEKKFGSVYDAARGAGMSDRAAKAKAESVKDQYVNRAIKQRAETIARTETIDALNKGQKAMWMQGVDDGIFDADMEMEWFTAADERVCPYCGPLNGKKQMVNGEPFSSGPYTVETPPLHPGCRCTLIASLE